MSLLVGRDFVVVEKCILEDLKAKGLNSSEVEEISIFFGEFLLISSPPNISIKVSPLKIVLAKSWM